MSDKGANGLAASEATQNPAEECRTAINLNVCSQEHRLGEFEEARGRLMSVISSDGHAVARFSWGSVAFPEELREELEALEGHEIACLRLDGKYHVRAVD